MKRLKYMLDPLTGSIAFLSFAHWEYSSLIQVLLLLAHCHQVRLYVGMLWVLIGAVTWLWEEITKTRWGREIKRRGGYDSSAQCYRHVHVEYQCEVARIFSDHESAGAMDSSLTTHTSSSQTIPTASNPQTTPHLHQVPLSKLHPPLHFMLSLLMDVCIPGSCSVCYWSDSQYNAATLSCHREQGVFDDEAMKLSRCCQSGGVFETDVMFPSGSDSWRWWCGCSWWDENGCHGIDVYGRRCVHHAVDTLL